MREAIAREGAGQCGSDRRQDSKKERIPFGRGNVHGFPSIGIEPLLIPLGVTMLHK